MKKVFQRAENNGAKDSRRGHRQYMLDSRLLALFDRCRVVRAAQQHRAERHYGTCDNSQPPFEFIPLGTANFLLNLPLMILALVFIGWRFVAKTLWVTAILSALLDLFGSFMPTYTGDKILAAIFCGVCTGAGLAVVFMRGATTGGTDIIGRLVHKAFPHIQIGKVIMAADALIVILGAVVLRSVESAMYAVIVIFVNSRLLDYILYGTGSGKLLLAVTEHAQEISDAITSKMGRGITILPVKGGYTGKEKSMVVCAVKKNEVPHLTKIIRQVDTETFIIITEAGEILGEGFIAPGVN